MSCWPRPHDFCSGTTGENRRSAPEIAPQSTPEESIYDEAPERIQEEVVYDNAPKEQTIYKLGGLCYDLDAIAREDLPPFTRQNAAKLLSDDEQQGGSMYLASICGEDKENCEEYCVEITNTADSCEGIYDETKFDDDKDSRTGGSDGLDVYEDIDTVIKVMKRSEEKPQEETPGQSKSKKSIAMYGNDFSKPTRPVQITDAPST